MKFQSTDPAMRILENEHQYLMHLMYEWHQIVLNFEDGKYEKVEALAAFKRLRKLLIEFIEPLKNHTEKEEKYFFPLLGHYIGTEQGPIVTIEAEHEEIDAYIGHFLHHTREGVDELTLEEMTSIAKDAGEAFEVLMVHFVKEQSVLFPMTERVMKAVDQDKLLEQLNTLIV
ncbi:hemerythrin domain-containing protein [Psychrobacillus sp.]|uniref:hemerythrin domain-containing protein n=1 Tax=Psychrobacillus sp. TaxID=1871623 RepID=UPI0028BE4BD7|nr:hemerythrin domain-containing protein [Psychrobacillus sp.]